VAAIMAEATSAVRLEALQSLPVAQKRANV
jgi:hypothetical protein